MREAITPGVLVLGVSAVLGLCGVLLFSGAAAGLNIVLFALLVAGGSAFVRYRGDVSSGAGHWASLALMVLFATTFAWRDSAVLHGLACAAMLLAYLHLHLGACAKRLAECSLYETNIELGRAAASLFTTTPSMIRHEIPWGEFSNWHVGVLRALARGVAGFIPVALLFGSLLVRADARFETFAVEFFDWDLALLLQRLAIFALSLTLAVSVVAASAGLPPRVAREIPLAGWRVGAIEMTVMLSGLCILFACYIVVQLSYFFGDHALVRGASTHTYSSYARRGFFELVWLSVLLLPTLVVARWLVRDAGRRAQFVFKVLAGILVASVLVIGASAIHRMVLYVEAYGLTELRLYCSVFMVWMAVVYLWYCATELVTETRRFAHGTVTSALVVTALLVVLNPDAVIARTNIHRLAMTHGLDRDYLTSLSSDAVPVLLESLARDGSGSSDIAAQLRERFMKAPADDWRAWNRSRARASGLLRHYGVNDNL